MGGTHIYVEAEGTNIRKAFRNAQEEARSEYGYDPYNGQINNADNLKDVSHVCKTSKQLENFGNERDEKNQFQKGDAIGCCIHKPILNENKIKTHVERFPQKGARKWVTYYEVEEKYSGQMVGKKANLTSAIKVGRDYTEKYKLTTVVNIIKHLEKGNDRCAVISSIKGKEKPGLYAFYAFVSC